MKSLTHKHTTGILPSLSLLNVLSSTLISGFTWIVALLFTFVSISLQLSFTFARTLLRLSLKWAVYLLLGTIFLCAAFLLAVLSIITLGAVSLP